MTNTEYSAFAKLATFDIIESSMYDTSHNQKINSSDGKEWAEYDAILWVGAFAVGILATPITLPMAFIYSVINRK